MMDKKTSNKCTYKRKVKKKDLYKVYRHNS